MRKTALAAAGLAMSISMAGIAYAAAPSGSTPTEKSSVTHSAADNRDRDGRDDPAGHDARDDSRGGRTTVVVPGPAARRGEGPAGDDLTHGHGHFGIHRFQDPAGHDAGDDHGHH